VSCVRRKLPHAAPARDLYISNWFRLARAYVEAHGGQWLILSAEHGLLRPDDVVAPYDRPLLRMSIKERQDWADRVACQLRCLMPDWLQTVVVLAGARYREFLLEKLRSRSERVFVPLEGQGIGQQMRTLKRAAQR
jgi:hypothetical protein